MSTDNFEDLVKCGHLHMKLPRKQRKLGREAWKPKWFILRRKSCQGCPRLEYHKSEESCLLNHNKTVVDLKGLIKIEDNIKSKTKKFTIKLVFADTFLILSSTNENYMREWERLIRRLVLPEPKNFALSARLDGCFPVTVIHTEDSDKLSLVGDYMLIVTHEHLTLYRNDEHLRRSAGAVCKWDLDDIPRFRLQKLNQLNDSEKIFIVNLARTSQTCEGEFHFLTESGRDILEAVKSHTKSRRREVDHSNRSSPVHVESSTSSFLTERSRSSSRRSDELSTNEDATIS